MPRLPPPDTFTLKDLIPQYYGPNWVCVHWYVSLPNQGALVYVGDTEDEVRYNLSVLNKLALHCKGKWKGIVEITITTVGGEL